MNTSIMNYLSKLLILVAISITVASCSSRQSAVDEIADLEEQLYGDAATLELDLEVSKEITAKYLAYSENFPEDTLAAEYLFKAAEVLKNNHFYGKSIELFERVDTEYPNFRKAPHALFMRAFIMEENLGQLEESHEAYSSFITKYPDHELVAAARFSMKNLGRDEAEIIREFEDNLYLEQKKKAKEAGETVEEESADTEDHSGHDHAEGEGH